MTACCARVFGRLCQSTSNVCRSGIWTSDSSPVLRRCYATERVKKLMKQERLKDQVFQYVGKNAKKADRVYVWGYAATGALGEEEHCGLVLCLETIVMLFLCQECDYI